MAKKKNKRGVDPGQRAGSKAGRFRDDSLKNQLGALKGVIEAEPAEGTSVVESDPIEPLSIGTPGSEPEPDGADLFLAAVHDIDSRADAILTKYDDTPEAERGGVESRKGPGSTDSSEADEDPQSASDRRLFLDAVSDVNASSFQRDKRGED